MKIPASPWIFSVIASVLQMSGCGRQPSTATLSVRACPVNGEAHLIVMGPTVPLANTTSEERVIIQSPTRPVRQLKHYWDTAQDSDGNPLQVLIFISEDPGIRELRFGRKGYHKVLLNGEPVEVMAFQMSEDRWTFAIDGTLYEEAEGKASTIGAVEFRAYKSPTGEERRAIMAKGVGKDDPWCFESDGRVYEQRSDGRIAQIGWMGWRVVSLPEDGDMLVMMTRGMGESDPWSGRKDGKLYLAKP